MAPKRKAPASDPKCGSATPGRAVKFPKRQQETGSRPRSGCREKFSFMNLPPEIRLHIYSYLFPDKTVPSEWERDWSNSKVALDLREDGRACHLAVVATCRLIHEEAMDLLYGTTCYCFTVRGRQVSACLKPAPSWHQDANYPRQAPGWTRWGPYPGQPRGIRPPRHAFPGSIFKFIRHAAVVVVAKCTRNWSRVSGIAKRPHVSDAEFSEMFEAFDAPATLATLVRRLQDAPKLVHLKIEVDWQAPFPAFISRKPGIADTKWLLRGLYNARNFEDVFIGPISPISAYSGIDLDGETVTMLHENHVSLRTELEQKMMSNDAAESPRAGFDDTPLLTEFVRKSKHLHVFAGMCRYLFFARLAEKNESRASFGVCKKIILRKFKEEKQEATTTFEDVEPMLNALDDAGAPGGPGSDAVSGHLDVAMGEDVVDQ